MADNGSIQSPKASALPTSRFQVKWDSAVMSFQDVSSLDVTTQGLKRSGSLTMKRGMFKSDQKFWDWFNQFKGNTARRMPATISLLDQAGRPIRVWTLTNARPAKATGPDLNAAGNEVAIETIEIAHEGLTIASA